MRSWKMEASTAELMGRAKSLANLKRWPKGSTGNPNGRRARPKALDREVEDMNLEARLAVHKLSNLETIAEIITRLPCVSLAMAAAEGERGADQSPRLN
jgi:hypothetical protein